MDLPHFMTWYSRRNMYSSKETTVLLDTPDNIKLL